MRWLDSTNLNFLKWLQNFCCGAVGSQRGLPIVKHQRVLVFTTQPSHHSPSHTRWWWISMWRTQISLPLAETRRFAPDWHDLAWPRHKNVNSEGITVFGIHWDLRHMLCLFPPPLVSPLPPLHQLSSCADVSTLSQFTLAHSSTFVFLWLFQAE